MTITQLKYILAVAEHKNFTQASEYCYVTQPTLSMQILKLEEELGVQIFNRAKKPIELTEVGQKIVNQSKVIVSESNRILDIVDQEKGFIGGQFKLGIIPTITPSLLPLFLKKFHKKYPKVELVLKELNTENILKQLNDGHLDAAIVATPLENENMVELPLYYEPLVGFFNKGNALLKKENISPEDLVIDDLLLLKDGHCFKESVLNICSALKTQTQKRIAIEGGSFDTLIKLTKEELGVTLLPYLHYLDLNETDKKYIREFKKPYPSREVSVIYHKKGIKIQIISALHKEITMVIKDLIYFNEVKIISPLKSNKNF